MSTIKTIQIDDSRDRLRKTSYNLKTRPVRENKIEVMRMAFDLEHFYMRPEVNSSRIEI